MLKQSDRSVNFFIVDVLSERLMRKILIYYPVLAKIKYNFLFLTEKIVGLLVRSIIDLMIQDMRIFTDL